MIHQFSSLFWSVVYPFLESPICNTITCAMRGVVSPLNLVQSSQVRTKGPWGPLIIVRMIS
jgi:hypothetical protein